MKWDEAAVEAAIRALPVRTDGKAPDVSQMVEMVRLGVWTGQVNTLPRARGATQKQTMAELKTLCELSRDLAEHIMKMHSPALRMVEKHMQEVREERKRNGERRPLYVPLLLTIQLEGTFDAGKAAWHEAKNGGDLPQPGNRGTKPAAKQVAFMCARAFEAVTGKKSTYSNPSAGGKAQGQFLDFLGDVFRALGIPASPESMAREVREKRGRRSAQ